MAWPASHQDGRKAGGRASSELGAPAVAPGVSGRTKHSFGQDAAETGGWVGGLLGNPADRGCFPSLLPTHLPGSLPDTTPPSPTVELAVSRFPERGEGRGPRLLSHPCARAPPYRRYAVGTATDRYWRLHRPGSVPRPGCGLHLATLTRVGSPVLALGAHTCLTLFLSKESRKGHGTQTGRLEPWGPTSALALRGRCPQGSRRNQHPPPPPPPPCWGPSAPGGVLALPAALLPPP